MIRTALLLRALWWRKGFCIAVLLVGTITTAVAMIGPFYARSAAESSLTERLTTSPSAQTGMSFTTTRDLSDEQSVSKVASAVPSPGSIDAYPTRIEGASLPITSNVPGQIGTSMTSVTWRSDECAHLIVISGRCPSAAGEAIVDDNALHGQPNWRLGQTLSLHAGTGNVRSRDGDPPQGSLLDQVTIVGSYRPVNTEDPFWFGRSYFTAHLAPLAVTNFVDAVFVSADEFTRMPTGTSGEVDIDFPLDASKVRLASVAKLRTQVQSLQGAYPVSAGGVATISMRTELSAVFAAAADDRRQVDVDTLLVVVELAVLSWLVLFHVVTDAVEARGHEIALAKVRGLRPRALLRFALAEPLALLLASLPLGLLVALAVAHAFAAHKLLPGTPVVLTLSVGYAAAIAFAGSALAALIAARRILSRPVLDQWRNTFSRSRRQPGLFIVEIVLAVVAVVGLVALRAGSHHGSPRSISLLAPGLLVFAAALLGIRLLPVLGRTRIRPSIGSRHVGLFLALRQTVRRPAGLRLAALLAVAAGLASFAVAGEAVAQANRVARARTELGAPVVASVQFQPTHDPQAVVAQLDPDRKWAMAVATWLPDGAVPASGPAMVAGPLLAVEPSRLSAVGSSVRGQLSMTAISNAITDASAQPAMFRGTQLRVTVDASSITGPAPIIGLNYRQPHQSQTVALTTTMQPGQHDYVAAVACTAGCAFAGITWERPAGEFDAQAASVTVSSVQVQQSGDWTDVPVKLGDATVWRGATLGDDSTSTQQAGPGGLRVDFSSGDGSSALLVYGDSPARIPIVAGPGALAGSGDLGGMLDYTVTASNFVVHSRAGVLPSVLDQGVIADLDYLRIQLPDFDYEASWSVWLGASAPADAVQRLRSAGLIVQGVETEHARVAALGRQAPALALLLLLVCAIAATVLAVGATAVTLTATGRRRSFELAALRAVGVSVGSLRRACIIEALMLLGASLVLGVPVGAITSWLVMPAIPEFSDSTAVVLRFTPPLLPILGFLVAFAALLTVAAVVAGTWLAHLAVPSKLREIGQ